MQKNSMLRSILEEAVRKFGGEDDGMFNTAAFSVAMKDHFKLPSVLDGGYCARILDGLAFVVSLPGGCHWLYKPHVAGCLMPRRLPKEVARL